MELNLKRREVRVNAYGTKQVLRYPTVNEHQKYVSDVLKPDANEYELTKDFLGMLGMEKEVINGLEMPDMQEIILYVTGQKKT